MATESARNAESSTVESLAARLGDAITDLPEYERFVETQAAVQDSEEAQSKIAQFEQAREELVLSRQSGNLSQDQIDKLQTVQKELGAIPEMAEHVQAESRLEARLADVNDVISAPLAIDFGEKAGGCCEE